jgi:hypothetical protein
MVSYTVPGMKIEDGEKVVALLQVRLNALNDLALTLKHIHWNVVGPNFIAVHTMLDPQVDAVRVMTRQDARQLLLNFAHAPDYDGTVLASMFDVPTGLDRITCPVQIMQGICGQFTLTRSGRRFVPVPSRFYPLRLLLPGTCRINLHGRNCPVNAKVTCRLHVIGQGRHQSITALFYRGVLRSL